MAGAEVEADRGGLAEGTAAEGGGATSGSPSETTRVDKGEERTAGGEETVLGQIRGSLADHYPAEHPLISTATDTDDPRETPYACDTRGRPLYRGGVRADAPPPFPLFRLRQTALGPPPHGYKYNRGEDFVHYPVTDGQGVTRQVTYVQVIMGADPIVLGLIPDSEKVYSQPLYAEPHVKATGKEQYPQEDMALFAGGYHDRPRLDRAIGELHDVSLRAEVHRYRSYAYEAERMEQRLHQLAAALGGIKGELARIGESRILQSLATPSKILIRTAGYESTKNAGDSRDHAIIHAPGDPADEAAELALALRQHHGRHIREPCRHTQRRAPALAPVAPRRGQRGYEVGSRLMASGLIYRGRSDRASTSPATHSIAPQSCAAVHEAASRAGRGTFPNHECKYYQDANINTRFQNINDAFLYEEPHVIHKASIVHLPTLTRTQIIHDFSTIITPPMSQTPSTATSSSRFQDIFNAALKSYQKRTKTDIITHPLASQLQSCDSTSAILALLQDQVRQFDQAHSDDDRLTKWLIPTVNVLYAFSAAVSEGVSLVFSPSKVIFAAKEVAASKDILAELFERIGFFFNRLEAYTEVTPTAAMSNIITKIMVEVLTIFGIATKELRRGSAKKFLKKLAGRTDLEDAIKKLDRLTQEEARMAVAEVLKITHIVHSNVKVVDGKVERIDDKVEDMGGKVGDMSGKVDDMGEKVENMGSKVNDVGDKVDGVGDKVDDVGDKVEDMGQDIGNRVQCVDEKVQVVVDDGKEAKSIIRQTAITVDEIKWNQIKKLLRAWLSPVDPSTNHVIAQKAQHKGTTVWFFQGNIFIEWKSTGTGTLLWIHGKPGSGKSVICSSVIQDIMAVCKAGSALMAYFYFDFRDLKKQTCRDLLLSLVSQLSTRSIPYCDILHHVYETHEDGTRQPSDDTLKSCLKEMLRLPGQGSIFIILDALDECPDSSGIPSPRDEVLQLVKELVELHLQGLHICATSRPEVDIRAVLEPLASRSVSLHNQSGQTSDISDYIRNVVNLSSSAAMRRWRVDDKKLVIETLTERADGMFRWVFCQLDALRHCFPPNLRQFLNELPETLDETYERILRGINKAQKDNAHRLLQCLAVAVRPLRVEELAELLAFDFRASSSRGIPKLKEDWWWDDQEEAVLSTCSSLIAVVPDGDSRVVQFSHFSVKEYLTSPRLARSDGDVSQFHIGLVAAHTILAQACLGTLLQLDEHASNSGEGFPLVEYAARHWVDHAQFEGVASRIRDGMDDLFDSSKPHFAAWLRVHNMDKTPHPLESWYSFTDNQPEAGSPLYYAALCGFYDLSERLIMEHPEYVNARGGHMRAPLPAALSKRYFGVADSLHKHGAVLDVRGNFHRTPLHVASMSGYVDIMRWLLNHGADPNIQDFDPRTPLHDAAHNLHLDAVQVLLDHNANVNSRTGSDKTPLHCTVSNKNRNGKRVDIVERLLEHGADPNAYDYNHSTLLHLASSKGLVEVARALLSYGANVDQKDKKGRTASRLASSKGHREMTKLLLEHGAVAQP
ncbi:hypothetical protein EDB87DRAFT_1691449 [Lactarius vividus]|nr:hypothetical protein EDB87DRAFT_1691449 [Lactarius vividus]